jgi:xanthine dehydrogenase accessory factor
VSANGNLATWLDRLNRLCEQAAPCVVVTIAETQGSAPREAGAKMVVSRDACVGTIGGGRLEYQATGIARAMLDDPAAGPSLQHFALPSLGQCCGGTARLLFEPIAAASSAPWRAVLTELQAAGRPAVMVTATGEGAKLVVSADAQHGSLGASADDARVVDAAHAMLKGPAGARLLEAEGWLLEPLRQQTWDVLLFGAGHVGKALVQVLGALPCGVTWIDGRPELFPDVAPDNVRIVHSDWPLDLVDDAPRDASFLVMTHSHALDLRICEKILKRGDFGYFGLVGSDTKRARFVKRFEAHGIPHEVIERMVCPIGIEGVEGKHPGVIAVAVAAQLLLVRAGAPAVGQPRPDAASGP